MVLLLLDLIPSLPLEAQLTVQPSGAKLLALGAGRLSGASPLAGLPYAVRSLPQVYS